jgi:hypothetical protein
MNYLTPDWPAPTQVKAFTTVRSGWGNGKDNLQLRTLLQLPDDPIWLNQKHTATVVKAVPENMKQIADASYTDQLNHICVVNTADCLPILICNKQGTHVAAIHAGWRGLAGGIITNTINALALPANDLLVWLGPAIGPQKFEVGKDVYDAFTLNHPESASAFTLHQNGKWLADLYQLARMRLSNHGITHIYGGNFCPYTQDDLFFSFRRDKNHTGGMASVIWMSPW